MRRHPLKRNIRFILFLVSLGLFLSWGNARAALTFGIRVEGLEEEPRKNVELALTPPEGIIDGEKVDEMLLALFHKEVPIKVREALEAFGYYQPRVETSRETNADRNILLVKVDPGPPVRVAALQLDLEGDGAAEERLRAARSEFPLKVGDVLRQDHYEEGKTALLGAANDLGYLDAKFTRHVIRLYPEDLSARIFLTLDTGPRYYFGEVTFVPPLTYPEAILRRYLAFRPGRPYSSRRLARTQLNLSNADRFTEVTLEANKEEAQDFRVPVRIHLTPAKPKRFRFGAGYETDQGFGVLARYQDLNFQEWGQEINAELRISERLQGLAFDYTLPGTRNLDDKTIFKMGYKHEITDTYDIRDIFSTVEAVYRIGWGRLFTGYLQFFQEDYSVGGQNGIATLLIPGARYWHRRYDDPVRPTLGYRYSLEARGSAPSIGSNGYFMQVIPQGDALTPLGNGFSLLLRGQAGITSQTEPLVSLPPSLRFFAGGDNNLRGYSYQSLGPKGPTGQVVGGKNLLVGTLEIEKAFTSLWGVAAFYDGGNAFDDFSQLEWKQDVGLGVRIYTPVGPIRLDLARQIGETDNQFRVSLSIGFAL